MQTQSTAPSDLVGAKYVALAAAMCGLMVNEFLFVVHTGTPWQIAWTYPVALDIYAYAAFRAGRKGDVATALLMMAGSQAGAHLPLGEASVLLAVAPWAIVMPILLWRVHHLSTPTVVDVEDEAPSAGGAPTKKGTSAVNPPLPQQKKVWTKKEAREAIAHYHRQGITHNSKIAREMDITPQRVGQIIREWNEERELVAA